MKLMEDADGVAVAVEVGAGSYESSNSFGQYAMLLTFCASAFGLGYYYSSSKERKVDQYYDLM